MTKLGLLTKTAVHKLVQAGQLKAGFDGGAYVINAPSLHEYVTRVVLSCEKYALNEISNLMTKASPTRVYTMQHIWSWCQNEGLGYEAIPNAVRGVSYKPVWIYEDELKKFLEHKRIDVEPLFSTI